MDTEELTDALYGFQQYAVPVAVTPDGKQYIVQTVIPAASGPVLMLQETITVEVV